MPPKNPSFKRQVVGGVGWVAFARIGKQTLQIIINVILARLLSPAEFGLIGMVAVFVNFATLFSELGFAEALVQRKEIEERHLSSVFWLNLSLGALLLLLFIVLAPVIASFYGEAALIPITSIIGLNFLIGAFNDVQMALLQRSLAFRRLVLINLISVIVAGVVAVVLAASGFGVWSLVAQMLTLTTVEVIIMWWTSGWKPRLLVERQAIRELMGFSLNLVGAKMFNFWVRNLDNLLIGRFVSAGALGLYRQSYALLLLPTDQITQTLSTVMFPALSRIQDDRERIKAIMLRSQRVIALITMPMMVGLFIVAEGFVQALLGEQWLPMVPLFRVLCLVALKQPIGATTGWIYQSVGRTDLQFKWSIANGLFTFIGFFIGINWGVMGVAVAYTIRSYLVWYPAIKIPGRLIGMTFVEHVLNVASIFALSLVMGGIVWGVQVLLPVDWPPLLALVIQVGAGVVSYSLLVIAFRVSAYRDLVALLPERIRQRYPLRVL